MIITEIPNDNNSSTIIFDQENLNRVIPHSHVQKSFISRNIGILSMIYDHKLNQLNPFDRLRIKYDKVIKMWEEELSKIKNTKLPDYIIELFTNDLKKQKQENILKGATFNIEDITTLIYKSGKEWGYKYSYFKYQAEYPEFEDKIHPVLMQLDGEKVKVVGSTDLSDGQMKQLITKRKIVYAHIFDKDDNWHALLSNFMNVTGKETWNDGAPHYHYISNKWGITRDKLLSTLEKGEHPASSIHIQLLGVPNRK